MVSSCHFAFLAYLCLALRHIPGSGHTSPAPGPAWLGVKLDPQSRTLDLLLGSHFIFMILKELLLPCSAYKNVAGISVGGCVTV